MVSSMAMLSMYLFVAAIASIVTSAFLDWPVATAVLVASMLGLFVRAIPLNLAWDKTQFGRLLRWLAYYSLLAIAVYAAHYYRLGVSAGQPNVIRAEDAVYLSVATWTTTGASDLTIPRHARWLVSVQSMNGLVAIAVAISMIWLWCEERLTVARRYVDALDNLKKPRDVTHDGRKSDTSDAPNQPLQPTSSG